MKLRHAIGFGALSLIVITALGSCDLFGISIKNRITAFVDDLNTTRTEIYTNFDSASTQDYQPIQDITFWNLNFPAPGPAEAPYAITLIDYVDPSNVTGTIVGPPNFSETGLPRNIKFVMVKVGADYYIQQLFLGDMTNALVKKLRFWGGASPR
jgi:hypothetical protein